MSAADDTLEALAAGLRRRVDEQRRAEERLADFAFSETGAAQPSGRATTTAPPAPVTAWRYYVARTLHAAGEPGTLQLLERLRGGGPVTIAELAADDAGVGDRVAGDRAAVADVIGGLAVVGFVTRDLETNRVALAPLGFAVLGIVDALEHRLEGVDGGP